jgi:glycosyltransferase involved in cell wall biosynthesis
MTRCVFAIPGDLATPTGGYAYARKILPLLSRHIETAVCALPQGFPLPSNNELMAASQALNAAAYSCHILLIDGLAFGALPRSLIGALPVPIVALVHHPLGLEEGLSEDEKRRLLDSEGEALRLAQHVVVSSPAMARTLFQLFAVPPERITVVEPGILRGRKSEGSAPGEPLHIVSVGTLTPRKGFGVLVEALHAVGNFEWRATIAGALDRSPETAAAILEKIEACGLSGRIALAGTLNEAAVSALYSSGDMFALASLYEGYGMAFAEAMAHGLPVIASGDGAVRETVSADAGILCPVRDVSAIAAALRSLLSDPALRRRKADAAWQHARTLPTWEKTAAIIGGVLQRVAA